VADPKRIEEIEARNDYVTDDMLESAVKAAEMIYRDQQFYSPGVYLGVVSDLRRVSSLVAVMRHDVRDLLAELRASQGEAQKWRENHDNLARARRQDLAKVEAECERLRALLSLDGDYACEIRWHRKDKVVP
jgi:signal transduction histidine kinase